MNTQLFHNRKINEAMAEAKKMGFENIFVLKNGKLESSLNKHVYRPSDIAIVNESELILSEAEHVLFCWAVSCDGELGVVLGEKEELSGVLKEMLVE